MGKKKKKKKKKAPKPVASPMATALAGMREALRDPETQKRIAQGFNKLRPQAQSVMDELKANSKAQDEAVRKLEMPSMEGELRLPDKFVPRASRHDFYWICTAENRESSCAVKASYWREDSVSTQDIIDGRPGSRKGDWTVDIIGYNGGALFRLDSAHAKRVAESVLSAVGFEGEWRKYYAEHGHSTVEGGEMAFVPHDDPGPTIPESHLPSVAEQMTPDIPTGEPGQGPDLFTPASGGGSEAEFLGNTGGFGDSETPQAAPKEHKCCGHCDQVRDVHAPHTDGCPSGFDL
ncbi:gp81 [Mycobacterium phage Barnyard]|uniref:Uncharacterized protein n=1 Tax=Mycobacterium phage Barnyard TaxID=205880 RepID=Q855Z1_9CAUD|nr:gp81 [Mycobacterium phage Barnyard]AAN02135.1 hypothetical protein PBI_BARNYARD_81 [Mycobacterium phage Barnyard]